MLSSANQSTGNKTTRYPMLETGPHFSQSLIAEPLLKHISSIFIPQVGGMSQSKNNKKKKTPRTASPM